MSRYNSEELIEKLKEFHSQGKTFKEITQILNLSKSYIHKLAHRAGLVVPRRGRELSDKILEVYKAGTYKNYKDLAQQVGTTATSVAHVVYVYTWNVEYDRNNQDLINTHWTFSKPNVYLPYRQHSG